MTETVALKYMPYHLSNTMVYLTSYWMKSIYIEFKREDASIRIQRDNLTGAICAYYHSTIAIADAHTCCVEYFNAPVNASLIEYFNCFVVFIIDDRLCIYKAPEMVCIIKVRCSNKVKSVYDFTTKKHSIFEINDQQIIKLYEIDLFGDVPKLKTTDKRYHVGREISTCKFKCSPDFALGSLHGGGIGYAKYCISCGLLEVRELDTNKCVYLEKNDIPARFTALNERGVIYTNLSSSSIPITEVKYY